MQTIEGSSPIWVSRRRMCAARQPVIVSLICCSRHANGTIDLKTYSGDAIFTTDRLLELHGGERINPEANLDFYIVPSCADSA